MSYPLNDYYANALIDEHRRELLNEAELYRIEKEERQRYALPPIWPDLAWGIGMALVSVGNWLLARPASR